MKVRNFTLLLVLMIGIFSGCAVMNTSLQETAEIVKPGHPKIGFEYNYGLDLTSTVYIQNNPDFDSKKLIALPLYGIKAGLGLTEDMDINTKLWISFGGIGAKAYIKHRIPSENEKISMAVAPGITYVTTESDDEEENSSIDIAEIKSYGFEIPFLATYRVGEALAFTGMARYSADFIDVKANESTEKFMLNRFGFIGGISVELGPLYLRPEGGIEMAAPKNGNFGIAPIIAIGAGLDF
ncbi:MAG: hypothetical protein K8R49_07695 [Candidatus Cloacimonetes bacterium]|nr:hypothetical protein [Candidatus Cloacimonadota bacterium]